MRIPFIRPATLSPIDALPIFNGPFTDYKAGPSWRIGAWVDYTHYLAKNGTDQVNVFDGSHIPIRLNEVRWDSWAFRLKAIYLL